MIVFLAQTNKKIIKMERDRIVYFDDKDWAQQIPEKNVVDMESIQSWFGNRDLDEHLNQDGELVFYKLVPYTRVRKNVNFKLDKDI